MSDTIPETKEMDSIGKITQTEDGLFERY